MLVILKFTLYFGSAADRLNIDLTLPPNYKVKTFYSKLAHPSPMRPANFAFTLTAYFCRSYYELGRRNCLAHSAHGVLNSRQSFAVTLGISDRCAVCRNTETFSHAFCEFSLVPTVWNWVLTLINKLYPLIVPSSP